MIAMINALNLEDNNETKINHIVKHFSEREMIISQHYLQFSYHFLQ